MDREITKKERNRGQIWQWIKYILIILVTLAAFLFLRKLMSPKGNMDDFHIAHVERGDIQNTLTASGVVQPSYEREINAPVNTEIKSVILPKGTIVEKGALILELDREFTQLEYDKLYDELELKRNNIDKLKLQYDKDLKDLEYQDQIKELEISQLTTELADQERLLDIGGATAEDVESAELQLKVAKIQKKMLENNLAYAQKANIKEKANLELEYKIQQKKLQELNRKLSETSVKAPIDGVITWINEDIGRTVSTGEPLVRIADLERYIVEASSSDRNSAKIKEGTPVNVRLNQTTLKGSISTVLPEVVNNTVRFLVELEKSNSDILRPNMRAEVYLITGDKRDVLRIKNGAAFSGAKTLDVFLVKGNKAEKIRINKGLSNADFVEITSNNVREGQRIIISETDDYDHLDEFTFREE